MKFRATTLGEISGGGSYGLGASASMDSSGPKFLRTTDIVSGTIDWSKVPYCSADSVAIEKYKLFSEDIVISRTGANAGLNCIVLEPPENAIFAGYLVRFKINRELADAKYVSYLLRSKAWEEYVEVTRTGSAQPQFNAVLMGQFPISLPSLKTQKAVSSFLRALDAKIAANNAISKTLEDIAQTIFKSWFIDFDPVKAKMAGEKPAGMDAATAALFPDSMEESELGLIPSSWKVDKFGEVNNLLMGQSPPGDTYNSEGEGLPFYQGRTDFGFRFPKQRIFCTKENRVALPGETLISVRAPVGDVNQAIEKCIIGRGVASALHKSNSEAYTFSLLKSLYPRLSYFNGEGTVFGAINRSDFNNLLIVEPPTALVQRFEAICGPMNAQIRSFFLFTEALMQLRDSLLPRLISGELQIPDEMLAS
jgi:type I restriction enzyme S subunit